MSCPRAVYGQTLGNVLYQQCMWVGDHTSFNLLAGASFLFLSSSGAFSRRVLYKEMQGIGKVAMRTVVAVVAVRAMHISRAGVGPLQGQSPLVRDSLGGFGHRQIHHARRAGRGRSRGRGRVVSVERTLVMSSFSSDDERDDKRDERDAKRDERDASGDAGKYSSSVDDVVGFGRVIRDPRKSKADVLRDSLASSANVPGNPKASRTSGPGGPLNSRTLEKTGKPIILGNADAKTQDEWAQLDEHINEYPGERSFKAIGAGEADFVRSMRECVEKVVGGIEDNQMDTKESSGGKYISVTFRVMVQSPDEMKEMYELMKGDGRLKFFI